jgi:hypothetical protein
MPRPDGEAEQDHVEGSSSFTTRYHIPPPEARAVFLCREVSRSVGLSARAAAGPAMLTLLTLLTRNYIMAFNISVCEMCPVVQLGVTVCHGSSSCDADFQCLSSSSFVLLARKMSARIGGQSRRFGRRRGGAGSKAWRPDRQNRGVRFVRDGRLTLRSLAYRLGCRNRESLHNRSEPDERQVIGTRPCAIRFLVRGRAGRPPPCHASRGAPRRRIRSDAVAHSQRSTTFTGRSSLPAIPALKRRCSGSRLLKCVTATSSSRSAPRALRSGGPWFGSHRPRQFMDVWDFTIPVPTASGLSTPPRAPPLSAVTTRAHTAAASMPWSRSRRTDHPWTDTRGTCLKWSRMRRAQICP